MPPEVAFVQAPGEISEKSQGELLIPRLHARLLLPGIRVGADMRGAGEDVGLFDRGGDIGIIAERGDESDFSSFVVQDLTDILEATMFAHSVESVFDFAALLSGRLKILNELLVTVSIVENDVAFTFIDQFLHMRDTSSCNTD